MFTIPAYALGNVEWDDEKLAAHVMLQRSDDAYNLEPSTAKTTVQKQSSNGALLSLRSLIESLIMCLFVKSHYKSSIRVLHAFNNAIVTIKCQCKVHKQCTCVII